MSISEQDQKRLSAFFNEAACRVSTKETYYLESDDSDEGNDYCHTCGSKRLDELKASAPAQGWELRYLGRQEKDSQGFCETCSCYLASALTEYACESEVEHFLEHGFSLESDGDRFAMASVIDARGWTGSDFDGDSEFTRSERAKYFSNLELLCASILGELGKPTETEEGKAGL